MGSYAFRYRTKAKLDNGAPALEKRIFAFSKFLLYVKSADSASSATDIPNGRLWKVATGRFGRTTVPQSITVSVCPESQNSHWVR
jgi:hypothetical protein